MIKGMVSCIIPTYKRSDTLVRAVESIINQSYKNLEIIIVDDNEPNNEYSLIVQECLKAISDERLRYIQQEKHINGAVARNVGIKAAQGEYVAFLDDDDEWLEDKLKKQIEFLNNNADYEGISCLYTQFQNDKPVRKCPPYNSNNLHKKVLDRSVAVYTSTLMLRKKALDNSGYFDESLIRHQDLQLILDFLYNNKIYVINKYLVKLNIDLGENRATVDNIIKIKNDFFSRTKKHFELYNLSERKRIFAAHYFEIIFVALKHKNIKIAIQYFFKIGFNIRAYNDIRIRYQSRKKYSLG